MTRTGEVRFGDLLVYPLRSGVTVAKDRRGSGIRMINMGELFRYPRLGEVGMALVDIDHTDTARFLVEPDDLLFARRSLTLEGAGKCAIVKSARQATTWESSIIRARLDRAKADPDYYYYLFRSPLGRTLMESIAEQVAVAGIRVSDLRDLKVPYPDIGEQRAVAAALRALDDKIAANERIAVTTEGLLRSHYEMAGSETATVRIDEVGRLVRTSVKPTELSGAEPYIGLEHLPRKSVWLGSWGDSGEVSSAKSGFERGDILFGKLRPYFHKVGLAQTSGICSTDILVIRPKEEIHRPWLLMALSSDEVVSHASGRSDGTRMPRAKWPDLAEFGIPWPGSEGVARFQALAGPLITRVERGAEESRALAALRDTLLPQLVSGRLRVRDAERVVGDAV